MFIQVVQVLGSLLIVSAFIATQAGRLSSASLTYLVLNLVGSTVLTVLAALHAEFGFLLLEGVWACVSAVGVVKVLQGQALAAGH